MLEQKQLFLFDNVTSAHESIAPDKRPPPSHLVSNPALNHHQPPQSCGHQHPESQCLICLLSFFYFITSICIPQWLVFFKFVFIYDSHTHREREAETQAEGGAGSMHREPDVGFDPGSPGSRPGPKTGAKPLRHPGIPSF